MHAGQKMDRNCITFELPPPKPSHNSQTDYLNNYECEPRAMYVCSRQGQAISARRAWFYCFILPKERVQENKYSFMVPYLDEW